MVGFFNSEMVPLSEERDSLPVGADCTLSPLLPHVEPVVSSQQEPPIKRVVCSPDLPVFTITPAVEETAAVDSSTSGDKMFQCSFCQKTFNQKNTYQNHLRSHGKEGDDPYQCNYCGKTFAVPARLTRHYRTHTGEKPYQCEYCNKSFSVKENLSVHRRIHTKERPYKCDICERAFEHSGKLHRHMRIHTGERPHKCAVCAKTFIQSGQLVIHMRTHTGEKPYVCKSCGKGFTCSKQLKVHNRTHTGEKPYACDICGKSFGYNHVLKLHQVAHYGEKVYKCTICNETFTSKKTMECHIKSHAEPVVVRVEESGGGRVPEVGESSCASTSSDKENKTERESVVRSEGHPNMKELCHYLYPGSGLNPALLAAAAEARTSYSQDNQRYHEQARAASPSTSSSSRNSSPVIMVSLPVTEPPVYLVPDPLASMHRRYTPYNCPLPPPTEYLSPVLINLPLSKPIEQDPNDPLLTPPSSNPVSPVPSSSPDSVELVTLPREVLILPPRKRSKMILKSMETEAELANVRFSSVIHYAKAS